MLTSPQNDSNLEEELHRSEERLRDIAANTGEWIWETDAKGRYIYSSPGIEAILGYAPPSRAVIAIMTNGLSLRVVRRVGAFQGHFCHTR